MYQISRELYGFRMIFSERPSTLEVDRWLTDLSASVSAAAPQFGLLFDLRSLPPGAFDPNAHTLLVEGHHQLRIAGLERTALVVSSESVASQFLRLARFAGTAADCRIIHAHLHDDWLPQALSWIISSTEPRRTRRPSAMPAPLTPPVEPATASSWHGYGQSHL